MGHIIDLLLINQQAVTVGVNIENSAMAAVCILDKANTCYIYWGIPAVLSTQFPHSLVTPTQQG